MLKDDFDHCLRCSFNSSAPISQIPVVQIFSIEGSASKNTEVRFLKLSREHSPDDERCTDESRMKGKYEASELTRS